MEKKIRTELFRMTAIMVVLIGLGIYAHEFVIAGIQAKMALNLSIFATFGLAAWLAFKHVLSLKNEVLALKALQVDYGTRSRRPLDPYKQPAIIFQEPELLGQGYRMITEELGKQDSLHLSNATVQVLLHDVDQRIGDRKSTIMYFAGLMVFLGLLGAFMGLMKTVHSVGDLIGSMDVSGKGGADSFGKLIEGMKGPLNGMSVGFSSSLFGLMTSMVLGALERFMTSAMKTLRNEFEHWLSNIAELEATSEQAGAERADLAGVTAALTANSRTLSQLQDVLQQSVARHEESDRVVAAMAEQVGLLAGHVGQLADPRPLLRPVADSVAELARNQKAILVRMEETLHHAEVERTAARLQAEHDRTALRLLMEVMDTRAAGHPPIDATALHAQVDRLIALGVEAAERDRTALPALPAPSRGLWSRLSGSWRRKGNPHLRRLAAGQDRLSRDVRATFENMAGWLAGQRKIDRQTLDNVAASQAALEARLARLTTRLEEPGAQHDARTELEALARALNAEVESDTPAAIPSADRADRAA